MEAGHEKNSLSRLQHHFMLSFLLSHSTIHEWTQFGFRVWGSW
jgi:hypothetical protein